MPQSHLNSAYVSRVWSFRSPTLPITSGKVSQISYLTRCRTSSGVSNKFFVEIYVECILGRKLASAVLVSSLSAFGPRTGAMASPKPVHPCSDSSAESLFGKYSPEEFYSQHGVQHSESYIKNSRDMSLFTQSWIPTEEKIKGLVMVCHGYGADSGWMVQLTAIGIAERGYAVYAIDHQGHGRSDGLKGYIPDINPVVDDCIAFFESSRKNHSSNLPAFLYGESLGGAICLLIHLRQPKAWSGAILNGAMIGISDKFKPAKFLQVLLPFVAGLVPTWPIVPTKDIPAVSFKEPWKRALARSNPNRYSGKPRLGTAVELLRIVQEIEESAPKITIPLLLVHGELDTVTDPAGSAGLFKRASSSDKTLHIYGGMWHQLVGETPENMETVFGDIYGWLDAHSQLAKEYKGL